MGAEADVQQWMAMGWQDPRVLAGIGVAIALLVGGILWWMRARRRKARWALTDEDLEVRPMEESPPAGELPAEGERPRPDAAGEEPLSAAPPREAEGLFQRLVRGLARTRRALSAPLDGVFSRDALDASFYEDLEEALIVADVGVRAASRIVEGVREDARARRIAAPAEVRGLLRRRLVDILDREDPSQERSPEDKPHVILVVGVNGGGKTTTIGKLCARFGWQGSRVMVGAGDTFRAGAVEQLAIWAERTGADIVAHSEGADPAAVLYDALQAALARGHDVVLCDTAGRLQSRKPLMDQLGKVTRVIRKAIPEAPHEVLLVLDATIGQNALSQARIFGDVVGVTGLVLTKLDGTAKGGVVVAVCEETGLPVKYVGVGEKVDDLRPFEPEAFVDALLGTGSGAPETSAEPESSGSGAPASREPKDVDPEPVPESVSESVPESSSNGQDSGADGPRTVSD